MKQIVKFIAFDGTEFDNESSCRSHEQKQAPLRIVGLTIDQVTAALNREAEDHDADLAEALEQVGTAIARARRAGGDLKRTRRAKVEPPPTQDAAEREGDILTGRDLVAEANAGTEEGWEWAVIEIFGHRKHAGRIREVEQFGAKMERVDIPIDGDPSKGWETRLYGGSSIFSVSYTDEASVMKANRPYVSPYRIAAPPEPEPDQLDDGEIIVERDEDTDDMFDAGM